MTEQGGDVAGDKVLALAQTDNQGAEVPCHHQGVRRSFTDDRQRVGTFDLPEGLAHRVEELGGRRFGDWRYWNSGGQLDGERSGHIDLPVGR